MPQAAAAAPAPAVADSASGRKLDGPHRARRLGRSRLGRATGSTQSGRIVFFFLNLFLMRKQIPEKSRN
jgi:hypothetical protein